VFFAGEFDLDAAIKLSQTSVGRDCPRRVEFDSRGGSALVKAYVEETGTDAVLDYLRTADTAITHEIANVEARSAFARLSRDGHLTPEELDQVVDLMGHVG